MTLLTIQTGIKIRNDFFFYTSVSQQKGVTLRIA